MPFTLRVQLQLTLLTLLCLLWLNLIRLDPLAEYRVQAFLVRTVFKSPSVVAAQSGITEAMRNDPALGASPLEGQRVLASITNGTHKGVLVIYVGDCAGCTTIDLNVFNNNCAKNGLLLLLLTTGNPEDVNDFVKRLKFRPAVVIDKDRSATKSLNTIWSPRIYLLSRSGRLVWLQRSDTYMYDPFKDADFRRALEEVKNGK
ncbi:MAG: redoxin family protein [Fibrella sp.]|nr:redoxin family protein [Armatimonadota bacterium]